MVGLGLLALVFSFFSWRVFGAGFITVSQGGWNYYWIIAPLLVLAVLVIRILQIMANQLKQIPLLYLAYGAAGAFVVGVIALIHIFVSTSGICDGLEGISAESCQDTLNIGPGIGIWIFLILTLALTYFLLLSAQTKGEKLPFAVPGPKL